MSQIPQRQSLLDEDGLQDVPTIDALTFHLGNKPKVKNIRYKMLSVHFYYSKLIITVINISCTDCSTLISHWHQSYWCAWLFAPAFNKLCISYDNSGLFHKSSQLPRVINAALLNLTFKVLVFSNTTQWLPSVTLLTKRAMSMYYPVNVNLNLWDFRQPIISNPEFFIWGSKLKRIKREQFGFNNFNLPVIF